MAIDIFCPFCGGKTRTRTSERFSLLTVKATINCPQCGLLHADFVGQLTNVKRAVFVDCPEAASWTETENEQIKEGKLKRLTNEERLKALMEQEQGQTSLFPAEKTPAERIKARQAVQRH